MAPAPAQRSRYFGGYISEEAAQEMQRYKYGGRDDSLMLKYITTPLYDRIMEYIPLWVAPNVITLSGLAWFLVSYLVSLYYCPLLEGAAPWWTYMLHAVAILAAQTLDNLDGKQARKTGSSSPMGVLIDHGVDCMCITLFSFYMAATVQTGPTWKSLAVWACSAMPFYWSHIEELYTGAMVLGPINGVNEGMLIASLICLATAVYGPGFWIAPCPLLPSLKMNECVVFGYMPAAGGTIAMNAWTTYQAVSAHKAQGRGSAGAGGKPAKFSYRVAATRPLPFTAVVLGGAVWAARSPTDVLARNPHLFIGSLGLLFAKFTSSLILCHMTDQEYHPWGKTVTAVSVLALQLLPFLSTQVEQPAVELWGSRLWLEDVVLLQIATVAWVSYLHFASSILWEMSDILGVKLLTIPKAVIKRG